VILGDGQAFRIAVDGAPGGSVDELPGATGDRKPGDPGGAAAVDFEVANGVDLADFDAGLCRVVVDHFRPEIGEHTGEFARVDIDLVEGCAAVYVGAAAGGEVIDHGHFVAPGQVGLDDVGADEAGPRQ